MRRGNLIYLLFVVIIAVVATVVLSYVCGLHPLLVTLLVIVGVAVFGMALPGRRAGRRQDAAAADTHDTCRPILKRYRRKRNVARLMSDYRAWCTEKHDAGTHALFSQNVASLLVGDGRFDEAREVLADGARVARKARLSKDYERFVAACEERMRQG